jgi:hypothetical protein
LLLSHATLDTLSQHPLTDFSTEKLRELLRGIVGHGDKGTLSETGLIKAILKAEGHTGKQLNGVPADLTSKAIREAASAVRQTDASASASNPKTPASASSHVRSSRPSRRARATPCASSPSARRSHAPLTPRRRPAPAPRGLSCDVLCVDMRKKTQTRYKLGVELEDAVRIRLRFERSRLELGTRLD